MFLVYHLRRRSSPPLALFAAFFALTLVGAAHADAIPAPEPAAAPVRVATAAGLPSPTFPAPATGARRIVLYEASWCGHCRQVRQLLRELGTPFVEKDVERSESAYREFWRKGKGSLAVPLLDVGGALVRGYKEEEIRRLVADLFPVQQP
ncbi:MAG TPA: glutaredoxin family protein [Thermoanaerobaculia bacterium]|nr:glutaredoxin family protein [Thermoanaerobaculia bacterium]